VILWLIDQRKPSDPDRVSLAAYDLRHNRSYWVAIDQLARYGDRGSVDAELLPERRAAVRTEGVRTLSLGPIPGREPLAVTLDGQELPWIDPGRQQVFHREPAGTWKPGAPGARGQKWHAASGPIGDLFHEGTILVPGTAGTEEEAFFASWVAGHAAGYYRARNGGVHRGGIPGENTVDLPVVPDRELTEESASEYNLLLYGTHASNSVMARFRADLPLEFDGGTIRVADRTYTAGQAAVFAVFPHPWNPERYVAVHGGVTPDAICWGSHLDMNLLPDYLVYSGGEVLDWGFWGNDWRSQAPA
jgi:hypothetical protein